MRCAHRVDRPAPMSPSTNHTGLRTAPPLLRIHVDLYLLSKNHSAIFHPAACSRRDSLAGFVLRRDSLLPRVFGDDESETVEVTDLLLSRILDPCRFARLSDCRGLPWAAGPRRPGLPLPTPFSEFCGRGRDPLTGLDTSAGPAPSSSRRPVSNARTTSFTCGLSFPFR